MLFTFRTLALVCLNGFLVGGSDLSSMGKQVSSSKDIPPSNRHLQRSYSLMGDTHLLSSVIRDSGSSDNNCNDDLACLMFASNDRHGLEAIRSLHRQLDDDANGAVDLSESDDFLREELQYETGAERRQKAFHRNDDMHISVKELWEAWVRSEVHNWTVEQTTDWLANSVGLPQYVPIFIYNSVNGATLPRLAVNNMHYLSNVLGIKDPIHKQKLALKAMDVVLFGPPKEHTNHIKDTILVIFLVGAVVGFWYAYRINKSSRTHLQRMMKDMESLQNAALTLETLQKELEQARQEQQCATTEKQDLERKLLEQSAESGDLRTSYSDLEVSQLKAEIEVLRNELQRAEGELEDRCWSPPVGLQQWLQLTHELENKAYAKKRLSAEKQLQAAREACEKLRKKRSSLVGAFVSTHGKSIDDVDRSIVEARTLLNEVTQELAERVYRWKQIELLCGFNIINNSGLAVLESVLYKNSSNGRGFGAKGHLSSQDDLLDEGNFSLTSGMDSVVGGADSSGSEKFDGDDDAMSSAGLAVSCSNVGGSVEFIVGDSDDLVKPRKSNQLLPFNPSSHLPLSHSQEFPAEAMENVGGVKLSHSDSNLEAPITPTPAARHRKPQSLRSEPPTTSSILLEEEAYSTDSNSTAADDPLFAISEKNHKKTKLRFPKFTRKSRHTPPPEKHT